MAQMLDCRDKSFLPTSEDLIPAEERFRVSGWAQLAVGGKINKCLVQLYIYAVLWSKTQNKSKLNQTACFSVVYSSCALFL